ncbi:DUF3857 domain-containing protein [Pedobacter sp. HMF7647]|uniref:DUF3857 domain-containing protein n=1 Tax=Hufsiella arboris TaxID=2695275 RepID=A0A7K1YCP4_9SPHI|nr:DUF3857 domain-containing protein [Hufsiella arboris]MXV52357.1 DUF3857 domain-containing protein [Hufsiella arboris]
MLSFFKRIISLVFVFASCFIHTFCQEKNKNTALFQASVIPDSLKTDADKVVRFSESEMVITEPGHVVRKHHSIVTVLNDKAEDAAELVLFYSKKYQSVNAMQMLIYDAQGKLIKKYNKSDAYDRSATDGFSVITDERLLALHHTIASFPTTVEISYEMSSNSYLDLGEWNIQPEKTAIQSSQYRVKAVSSVGFRFKNRNTTIEPRKTVEEKFSVYTWQVANLKAVIPEDDIPRWCVDQRVVFAADKFEFNGIPGDISSWNSYGKWYTALNADVNTLSLQRGDELKRMTANLKSDREKAEFLYHYLQQNVRYVSIQLGLGGLKPFPADFVDQKKYGDCKALVNYMYAMLKAVNIPSYYALVNAGTNNEPALADFPADPFNHIILCIPFKSDTTWLECTSNTQPFGKLGSFTENRNALLITEEGGKLVNTPQSSITDNQFNSEVHMNIKADGSADATVKLLCKGGYRDLFVSELPRISQDKQKEYLIRTLNFKQPAEFNFASTADKSDIKEVNFNLQYDTFSDISTGNRKFYRPRVFDLWNYTLSGTGKRKTDYYFQHPMQKSCLTVIDLPSGFKLESLPENVDLKFKYGSYTISYEYLVAKNEVISKAEFIIKNQVIPASEYAGMKLFMDNIQKAQNKKFVVRSL